MDIEKQDKWLHELLEIEAKKHVESCGTMFQTSIVKDIALRTFGKRIRQSWAFEQLTQVGKETGETAHVERWNCTLRQRLGQITRETFSFSKTMPMHILCLDLFLHRYNLDRAILLD